MGGYQTEYTGANYGLEPKYDEFIGTGYRTPASTISLTSDPRTANQLQVTSERFNTGVKGVEVQMLMPEVAESIPEQHLVELNRLKKLVGAEFTVHGPLIEPTGVANKKWDPTQREQAERQMWLGLQRAQKLDPDGNAVVTFHSSNGLPEAETKVVINEKTGEEKISNVIIIDERSGELGQLFPKEQYLTGKVSDPKEEIKSQNKAIWYKELQHVNFNVLQGENIIRSVLDLKENPIEELNGSEGREIFKEAFKLFSEGKKEQALRKLGPTAEKFKDFFSDRMSQLSHGDIYLRDAYEGFKNLYEKAYDAAKRNDKKEDLKKLDAFKEEISPKVKYLGEDPSKIDELAKTITKGVEMLKSISTPQSFRHLNEFAIEQASETFSNLAIRSFNEFKENAPVISIENPPAGTGLSRADDLRALVEATRKKFVEKAKEGGLSQSAAENQAEKLIGATWDVGHINMIRKYGYGEKALLKETATIAPFVKNIHLSDNFGMEHTELPMGMGNVPIKKEMEILDQYNKKVKKIIEAGTWYQHFKVPALAETLSAMGSPLYSMQLAPAWNQVYGRTNTGYFAGYGTNPDIHHSIYGAGFAGLPVELGGQIAGRSRLSGTPSE